MRKILGLFIFISLLTFIMIGCKSNTPVKTDDTPAENGEVETDDTQAEDGKAETNDTQTEDAAAETTDEAKDTSGQPSNTTMRDITTMELTREMGLGINLGNTFEACGDWINSSNIDNYIKAWGSPIITEKIIKGYADAGFGVLRIPVAWSNLMSDDGTYTINPDLMQKVKQAVDWTIESGMYAIINIHWDMGWIQTFPDNKDECMEKYIRIWTQICETFKDYGDYLMFESQNEDLGWQEVWNVWSGSLEGKDVSYALVNEINQTFVDVVRASGGNNSSRHLLIAGYNTGIEPTCDPLYIIPNDPAGRCAISIHYYAPSTLTILEEDASWGKARTTWGTEADLKELENYVQMMKTHFIDNGIPVIIGEYGCLGKNKTDEVKIYYNYTVAKALYDAHMVPVFWDTPGGEYNRILAKFSNTEMLEKLMSILE